MSKEPVTIVVVTVTNDDGTQTRLGYPIRGNAVCIVNGEIQDTIGPPIILSDFE